MSRSVTMKSGLGRPADRPRRVSTVSTRFRQDLPGYLFLLPTVVAVVAFTVYPLIETIRLSFTNSNGTSGDFVGVRNYQQILLDGTFWQALWNTVYMGGLAMLIGIPLSLIVATFIDSVGRLSTLYKAVYFAPNVTSAIAGAITFTYLLYPTADGWVNSFLHWFGIGPIQWLSNPYTARFAVVLLLVWHGFGYTVLIWLAGLQTISADLHDAGKVDGASAFQRWWSITLPGLRPVFLFIVVTRVIALFQAFSEVYQIGGSDGQPGGVLTTLMIYIYRVGFTVFDFGRASAATVILFVLILTATIINFYVVRRGGDGD